MSIWGKLASATAELGGVAQSGRGSEGDGLRANGR